MAAILKGMKFYGCMLATTRGLQSSYLRRDYSGPALTRQQVTKVPDFSRCLGIQTHPAQLKTAQVSDVVDSVPEPSPTPVAASANHGQSLDRALYRMDQDIRRSGRVSRRDVEEVFYDVKEMGGATSTQVLMMIRCCGSLVPDEPPPVRTQLVQEIWGSLEGMGVPLDVSHYNALLRVYIENEHKFSPLEFLSYMEQKGVEPNRVTYQRLITRFCQDGDIEGASKILEFMKQKELPINENVFNALIMGHARANDLESAKGIIAVMKQAQVEPSADTYTALLNAFAEKQDVDSMREIYEDCARNDVDFSDKDHLEVIVCLAESGYDGEYYSEIMSKFRKVSGFNQEAMNACMRLINAAREDVARKLLDQMGRPAALNPEDPSTSYSGGFFIRQMIKAKRPLEKTLEYIDEFERKNINAHASFVGLHAALQLGMEQEALVLMNRIAEKGALNPEYQPRAHYFWPLLSSAGKARRTDDVFRLLRRMTEMNLTISLETLSDYVLPYIPDMSSEELVSKLRYSGVGMAMTLNAVTEHLLRQGDVRNAARTATSYGVSYLSWSYLNEELRNAFLKTGDVENTLRILANLGDVGGRVRRGMPTQVDLPGVFVHQVMLDGRGKHPEKVEALLTGMADAGFGLSQSSIQKIVDVFGEKLTEKISDALDKLAAVEEGARPNFPGLPRRSSAQLADRRSNIEMLRRRLESVSHEDEETRQRMMRQLLTLEIREKNVLRVEELLREMEAEKLNMPIGYLAMLVDMYSQTGDIDKAVGLYHEFLQKDPAASMDAPKVIRLANGLVSNDRIPEAMDILRSYRTSEKTKDANLRPACWRLLNTLAEKKETDKIREVLQVFEENKIVDISNVLLGPLMKAHLAENDIDKAMATFEEAAEKYRCTPWKTELTVKLINEEDADRLQKVVDLSTKIHGEVNSLYDLVFCFLETGRTRQARRILETPGLRARNHRFEQICQRFLDDGRVDELENLINITRDLFDVDRGMLYMYLLKAYCKSQDTKKALGVWTAIQEEDLQPTPEFLRYLADYLASKGEKVPFVVPDVTEIKDNVRPSSKNGDPQLSRQQANKGQARSKVAQPPAESSRVAVLRRAIRNGDLEAALQLKEEIETRGDKVPVTDASHLIASLLGSERLGEAVKIAEGLRAQSLHPLPVTFKYLLARLAAAGDHRAIESLGKGLSVELRKRVSFDNHLCSAMIHAGRGPQVLSHWEETLRKDGIDGFKEVFPVGGALTMLFNSPDVAPQFEKLAVEAAEKGFVAPMNMMWIWLISSNNVEKSREVMNKYLRQADGLLFRSILRKIREANDVSMAEEVFDQVSKCPVSSKSRGVVLSALIDAHVAAGSHGSALERLKSALDAKLCDISDVNHTALERLKAATEGAGQTFPYAIPSKKTEKEAERGEEEQ